MVTTPRTSYPLWKKVGTHRHVVGPPGVRPVREPSGCVGVAMRADALAKVVEEAHCRVFGHEDAGNEAHRAVLAALVRGFDRPEATVLCEPSLARKTTRPPDAVLVDPVAGVHVVEIKGIT